MYKMVREKEWSLSDSSSWPNKWDIHSTDTYLDRSHRFVIKAREAKQYRVRMSSDSQQHFTQLAQDYNYCPTPSKTQRYGMNQVIVSLLQNNITPQDYTPNPDYFPDGYIVEALQYLNEGYFPTWYFSKLSRERITLCFSDPAKDTLLDIATFYSIYDIDSARHIGLTGSRISATLEAIGQGFLLPHNKPTRKTLSRKRRPRIFNLNWL